MRSVTSIQNRKSKIEKALAQQQFYGIESARERINDEMATRFDDIVEYQDTGR
jgi:hypothetical protein